MRASTLGDVKATCLQGDSSRLQRGIVGDGKSPIRVKARIATGQHIAINYGEEAVDLLRACGMRPNPPVFPPILQAHLHHRSEKSLGL